MAGDPRVNDATYFSGFPTELVYPISCPDNLTDQYRGNVEQFLSVPADAETCGPEKANGRASARTRVTATSSSRHFG